MRHTSTLRAALLALRAACDDCLEHGALVGDQGQHVAGIEALPDERYRVTTWNGQADNPNATAEFSTVETMQIVAAYLAPNGCARLSNSTYTPSPAEYADEARRDDAADAAALDVYAARREADVARFDTLLPEAPNA